jgi:FMN reductase
MPLNVLGVAGSLKSKSVTRVAIRGALDHLHSSGCHVDLLDLKEVALPMYNPDSAREGKAYLGLKPRVEKADVLLLGTPDYHGSISSPMKNFLDHFWHEFAGKLFATIVSSHEKGLTVTDQLRTVARQCYAWSLPYGVSFVEKVDVNESAILSDAFRARLRMMVRDVRVYGSLLARQRREDLACKDECFMARHRT